MANTLTFTGNIGPGNALSAKVFNNVTRLDIDMFRGVMTVYVGDVVAAELQYPTAATVTYTLSGGNSTVTFA